MCWKTMLGTQAGFNENTSNGTSRFDPCCRNAPILGPRSHATITGVRVLFEPIATATGHLAQTIVCME